MRARRFIAPRKSGRASARSEQGFSLAECLVACVIGSILMMAVYDSASAMYRASVSGENQVLATNMAQQVLDNARNTPYASLNNLLNGGGSTSQVLSLYTTPTGSNNFFPRPLLRNLDATSGMTYTQATINQKFPGTVTETITQLAPYDSTGTTNTGELRVTVQVQWQDNRGSHTYTTSTNISQSGVHN